MSKRLLGGNKRDFARKMEKRLETKRLLVADRRGLGIGTPVAQQNAQRHVKDPWRSEARVD